MKRIVIFLHSFSSFFFTARACKETERSDISKIPQSQNPKIEIFFSSLERAQVAAAAAKPRPGRQPNARDRRGQPGQRRPEREAERRPRGADGVDGCLEQVADRPLHGRAAAREPRGRGRVQRDGNAEERQAEGEAEQRREQEPEGEEAEDGLFCFFSFEIFVRGEKGGGGAKGVREKAGRTLRGMRAARERRQQKKKKKREEGKRGGRERRGTKQMLSRCDEKSDCSLASKKKQKVFQPSLASRAPKCRCRGWCSFSHNG